MKSALLSAVGIFGFGLAAAASERNQRIENLLPALNQTVQEYARAFAAPGVAVAIVTPDQVRYLCHGVRVEGKSATITPATIFQLASVSKPITATFAAALVSQGKLRWDTLVVSLLPWFSFANPAVTRRTTICDLLSQRSGLPGETGDFLETLGYDEGRILQQMRLVDTTKDFRQRWAYANFGITIGGVAAAAAIGKPFDEAAREELFRPAGMRTAFVSYRRLTGIWNRARLHFTIGSVSRSLFIRDAQPEAPGGGMNGSVRDLAALLQLYLNDGRIGDRQLISKEVLRQLYEPISDLGNGTYYGLCWNVRSDAHGPAYVSHSGAFLAGARTEISFWPQAGIGIVVLTNNFPSLLPEAISEAFHQLYESGRVNADTLPKFRQLTSQVFNVTSDIRRFQNSVDVVNSIGEIPLSAYVGTYENAYVGRVKIYLASDPATRTQTLFLQAGPRLGPVKIQRLKGSVTMVSTTKEGDPIEYEFHRLQHGTFREMAFPALKPIGWEKLGRVD